MNYGETLEYIHSLRWRGSKDGLARVSELLGLMGNPQDRLRFVHVAGTNGKGSVCSMLESVLRASGLKTGLYISPYISRFNERMQVNCEPIEDDLLCEITEYVKSFAERMTVLPSEFEFVCAVAMEYFLREHCDIVVLEVGMGGRFDATNVIKSPEVSVITPIGLDHTKYLGDTVEKIAFEKCGIIKKGRPTVFSGEPSEVLDVVKGVCRERGSGLTVCDGRGIEEISHDLSGQRFCYRGRGYGIRLLGAHQQRNAAVVLETVECLKRQGYAVSDRAVAEGLAAAKWPGRCVGLGVDPPVIVDGAHNAHGVAAAVRAARDYLEGRALTVVMGVLADKNYHDELAFIGDVATRIIATEPDTPRALPCGELARLLGRFGKPVTEIKSPAEAVKAAAELCGENGAVLALGSLYMVGEIRQAFGRA